MLHQIANSEQFNLKAGRRFERFCAEGVRPLGGQLYLKRTAGEHHACKFYEWHGMTMAGTVVWRVWQYRGWCTSGMLAESMVVTSLNWSRASLPD
jgi:hypothetical protein